MDDWERCGNEVHSLLDLIRHHGGHGPTDVNWVNSLTAVALGLQSLVFSARIKDRALGSSLAKQGLEQATHALGQIKLG